MAQNTAKEATQKSFGSDSYHRREASEVKNDLGGFQAPKRDLCLKMRDRLRRYAEKKRRVSDLQMSCGPASSKRVTNITIEKEAAGSRVGSGTGATVRLLMTNYDGRSGI